MEKHNLDVGVVTVNPAYSAMFIRAQEGLYSKQETWTASNGIKIAVCTNRPSVSHERKTLFVSNPVLLDDTPFVVRNELLPGILSAIWEFNNKHWIGQLCRWGAAVRRVTRLDTDKRCFIDDRNNQTDHVYEATEADLEGWDKYSPLMGKDVLALDRPGDPHSRITRIEDILTEGRGIQCVNGLHWRIAQPICEGTYKGNWKIGALYYFSDNSYDQDRVAVLTEVNPNFAGPFACAFGRYRYVKPVSAQEIAKYLTAALEDPKDVV